MGIIDTTGPGFLLVSHAVIMVLTWGIMVPASLVITRFFKVMPGQNYPEETDSKFWMRTHRVMSTTVVFVSTFGAGVAVLALNGISFASLHAKWGFAVVVLGWCQLFIAMQRGTHGGPWGLKNPDRIVKPRDEWFGDHYNMTLRRRIFETIHISTGYLTAIAGMVAITLGIIQFGLAWPWHAAYGALVFAILFSYWKFSRQGRRVPTYQAIWGLSPEHPGNQERGSDR